MVGAKQAWISITDPEQGGWADAPFDGGKGHSSLGIQEG